MKLPKDWKSLDSLTLIGLLDKSRREAEEKGDDESWNNLYEIQEILQERFTNIGYVNDKVEQLIQAVKELQRIVGDFRDHTHSDGDGIPVISKRLQEPKVSAEI